jgi:hypothetical protein
VSLIKAGRFGECITIPSLKHSLLIGGIGFCLASLCVFATVAFAEQWMYGRLGLSGAYIAWTALFIVLGGGVLGWLVVGPWRLPKFYLLFGLAFFAYASAWVTAYFILRGAVGEWVGSLAGSVLMSLVLAYGFGIMRSAWNLSIVVFVANSAGYFLGSALNDSIQGKIGMLIWGAVYGFCLGAGLGTVLHLAQTKRESKVSSKQK